MESLRQLLLLCLLAVTGASQVLNVPEDVMSFIMGCDGRFGEAGPKIPVARTDIDTKSGTKTKEISMMNIAQLRKSLMDTVESDEVVGRILAQVEESLQGRHAPDDRDAQCTNIKVEVPAQEVPGLSEQLQAVIQQNNYQLLEQVNTLFAFKLNSFYREVDELITAKLTELGAGLLQFQQAENGATSAPVTKSTLDTPEEPLPQAEEQPQPEAKTRDPETKNPESKPQNQEPGLEPETELRVELDSEPDYITDPEPEPEVEEEETQAARPRKRPQQTQQQEEEDYYPLPAEEVEEEVEEVELELRRPSRRPRPTNRRRIRPRNRTPKPPQEIDTYEDPVEEDFQEEPTDEDLAEEKAPKPKRKLTRHEQMLERRRRLIGRARPG